MQTFDQATIDSTGAFYVNELERLDQTVHEPLVDITWGRDIMLREDVTVADETSSFLNNTFGSTGGLKPGGISWAGKNANAIQSIQLDSQKTAYPLTIWAEQLDYTIPELMSSKKAGRPVDAQKYDGLRTKHQMDIDQMVYIGDADIGLYGLANSPQIVASNVAADSAGNTTWAHKLTDSGTGNGPLAILNDVNTALATTWAASGWAIAPGDCRIPPNQFGLISTPPVTSAGVVSIITYLEENNIYTKRTRKPLRIDYVKWLAGAGAGGSDRMLTYTNDQKRVRYPMTDLQRTPVEYRGLYMVTTYWGRLGAVEFVYPNTLLYSDGI